MAEILTIILLGLFAFMVADHALGRLTVSDPLRAIVATVFAVLVVIFTRVF
jgi:hypothetical protein